ncbi:hypothetical protein [Dialister succinatiphilus]|uniref:hypothetical protein n=1 Tax=Dialister succinatiphilus TaxID=487173 RepID=UPI003F7DE73D
MKIEFNGTPGEVIMEVEDFLELKSHKNDLTPEAAQAVTKVVIDTVKKEAKAKLAEKHVEEQKAVAPAKKEEKKPEEADMNPAPEPVQTPKKEEKTSPADLRTMCANYCHKVPDGKQRIKEWLDGKGYKKVSEIPDADLPEFKALVNI